MIQIAEKRLGDSSYRISIDKKVQKEAAKSKKINLKDPLFGHLTLSAREFTKSRSVQKELASVFRYYTISHWVHDLIRSWVKMEHDFNYIIVLLQNKGMKHDAAVKLAVLIFRAELLTRAQHYVLAHNFDRHLKMEMRRNGLELIIRYVPHLEIHENFEKKLFK